MTTIGAHLLGRRPTTPDERDFTVSMIRGASALQLSYQKLLASRRVAPATKDWVSEAMKLLDPVPVGPPTPGPVPPDQNVNWSLTDPVLDQGDPPHCGGFGGCQWGNTLPVDDRYGNEDGHKLYYESVSIGGYPDSEDGVESRWVAKALQARGRLSTYAFAKSTTEVTEWLRAQGPVMIGTDWTQNMMDTGKDGYIVPTGDILGGHFTVLLAHQPEEPEEAYMGVNSWGDWGVIGGFYRITVANFGKLLKGLEAGYPGDAIVSPELALA